MASGSQNLTTYKARILAHNPDNTTTFLRGDNTWSSILNGSITISKADECGLEVINSQTTNPHKGFFGGSSSGNLGIYDRTYNKWVVYSDPSGNVILNGNANNATKSGINSIWLYPENNSEINFGGTNTNTVIHFGYRAKDSRPLPTKFVFGGSTGTADLQAKTVYLGSGTTSYISATQYTGNAATASKISAALANNKKTYLLGTQTAITATAANVSLTGDTGVYLTTTVGELSAIRHSWNVSGTEKAYTVYNTTDDSIDFVFI